MWRDHDSHILTSGRRAVRIRVQAIFASRRCCGLLQRRLGFCSANAVKGSRLELFGCGLLDRTPILPSLAIY